MEIPASVSENSGRLAEISIRLAELPVSTSVRAVASLMAGGKGFAVDAVVASAVRISPHSVEDRRSEAYHFISYVVWSECEEQILSSFGRTYLVVVDAVAEKVACPRVMVVAAHAERQAGVFV